MMKKYEKHMGVWCCLVMSINVDAHLCPAVKVTAHVFGPSWMGNTRLEKVSDRRIGSVAHNGWLIKKWMENIWKNDWFSSLCFWTFGRVPCSFCSDVFRLRWSKSMTWTSPHLQRRTWPDMAWHGLTPDHPMTCFFHPAWFPHFAPTWAKQAIEVKI